MIERREFFFGTGCEASENGMHHGLWDTERRSWVVGIACADCDYRCSCEECKARWQAVQVERLHEEARTSPLYREDAELGW